MRTCGGTAHLSPTLYHAGLTVDLAAVLRILRQEGRAPAFVVGFSLGGNVALKLAGELGESAAELMRGVCGVSAPLDLEACARRIAARDNRLYERRFVRKMRRRLLSTGRYVAADLAGLDSLIAIDDRITAPSFGLGTADNYYRTQSRSVCGPDSRAHVADSGQGRHVCAVADPRSSGRARQSMHPDRSDRTRWTPWLPGARRVPILAGRRDPGLDSRT